MAEKYVGYSLLTTGVVIMIFATVQIVLVISGKAKPFEIINYQTKTTTPTKQAQPSYNVDSIINQYKNGTDISGDLKNSMPQVDIGSSLGSIIDTKSLNQIINLSLYYLIMQFVLGLGFKISTLGTQLVRPIIVKVDKNRIENAKETVLNN